MIIYTLDASEFSDLFDQYNRSENFTLNARKVLFEYYDELSDDIGEPFEADIIAICCDWIEYTPEELCEEHGEAGVPDDDLEEYATHLAITLQDETTVLEVPNGNYLVQAF